MSDLGGPRRARWRLVERLVELASPPDAQLSYLGSNDQFASLSQKVEDLAIDFWNWCDGLPALVREGVISPEIETMVSEVVEQVRSLDHDAGTDWDQKRLDWLYTPEALAIDARWAEVRKVAGRPWMASEEWDCPSLR